MATDVTANENGRSDADGAEMYQGCRLFCKSFTCLSEQELKEFGNTLLYDSGETIAKATFVFCKDCEFTVSLVVNGDIRIVYNDGVYKNAAQYPNELIQLLKESKPGDPLPENLFIDDSNWLEYVYKGKEDITICERDITKATPEDILGDMTKIAEYYLNTTN